MMVAECSVESSVCPGLPEIGTMGMMAFDPIWAERVHANAKSEILHVVRERLKLTEREVIGRKIADAVDRLLPTAAGAAVADPVLRHMVENLPLPWRRVTEEELAHAQAEVQRLRTGVPRNDWESAAWFRRSVWFEGVVERHARQKVRPFHEIEHHVLRLGEIVLATNPFELFLDYGLRIQARSKAVQSFLVQLACGYDGYLPTAKAVRAGSYGTEPASNAVGPEGGQVLVDRTVALIEQLWAGYSGCINIEYEGEAYRPAEAVRKAAAYLRTLDQQSAMPAGRSSSDPSASSRSATCWASANMERGATQGLSPSLFYTSSASYGWTIGCPGYFSITTLTELTRSRFSGWSSAGRCPRAPSRPSSENSSVFDPALGSWRKGIS